MNNLFYGKVNFLFHELHLESPNFGFLFSYFLDKFKLQYNEFI